MRFRLPIAVTLLLVLAPLAHAAPPPPKPTADALTPAQAQQALAVLQDDAKRTQLLQVLKAIATASPAPGAGHPVLADGDGLGGQVMRALSDQAAVASKEVSATMTAVANFPLLWDWLVGTFRSPSARDELFQATWRLVLVLCCGVAAHALVYRLRRRPAHTLETMAEHYAMPGGSGADDDAAGDAPPEQPHAQRIALLRRVPLALGRFLLTLLGPAAFALVTYVMLGLITDDLDIRQVIIAVINAYLLATVIMCVAWLLLAPDAPALRLIKLSDEEAITAVHWLRRLVVVATFGPALVETSQLLGLYFDAAEALNKLLGLVFAVLLMMLVLRVRAVVSKAIAGPPGRAGFVAALRRRMAMAWHLNAIFLIAAAWVVWAFEVSHGFAVILRLFLTTAVVVAVARLAAIIAFAGVDRLLRANARLGWVSPALDRRTARYASLLRRTLGTAIVVGSIIALLELWGLDVLAWFDRTRVGAELLSAVTSIATMVLIAWVMWEIGTALLDGQVAHLEAQMQTARAARWRTLVPILRTLLLSVMLVFVVLAILSEIGVNTAPLLAGASIFGVALGFGSQKLVQDFITGLFLLLENAMQVGDNVTVSGLSGSVEYLSIRTIRLRAGDGAVHIIPFSSVTTVTNVNRGVGNAAVTVTVAAHEDTDRVSVVLKEIALQLREDGDYGPMILGELALWGIDKVDGSGITIAGQIACTDSGRWGVQREFNRRMKRRLQDEGIALAVPVQTVVVQHERDAPVVAEQPTGPAAEAAAPEVMSPPPEAQGHAA